MHQTTNQLKIKLRKRMQLARAGLSKQQIATNSQAIIEHLLSSTLWAQAKNIALYLPFNNEIDLQALLLQDKNFYLPSIANKSMQFHRYQIDIPLVTTSFGLRQPRFHPQLPKPNLDLCLMPLLAFDQQGNRLGMGGGFYDRYFENNSDTILVGVAHAIQHVNKLPTASWDVKLNAIVTEQGLKKYVRKT